MFIVLVFVLLAGGAADTIYNAPAPDWTQTMQRDLRGG